MKIEKLIQIFEQCIPTYQKCVDEKWDYKTINKEHLEDGICNFCDYQLGEFVYDIFIVYYKYHLIYGDYLFPTSYYEKDDFINKCIKPRLKFLKEQVKELKKLQKQGYTHV